MEVSYVYQLLFTIAVIHDHVGQGDEWVEEVMSMTVWKMADSQRYSDPQYQESSSLDYSILHSSRTCPTSGFCRLTCRIGDERIIIRGVTHNINVYFQLIKPLLD